MAVDHAAFARAAAKRAKLPAGTMFTARRVGDVWIVTDEHNRTVAHNLTMGEAFRIACERNAPGVVR